jgi:hypothetical protein
MDRTQLEDAAAIELFKLMLYGVAFASALHKAHDAEENSNEPRVRLLWAFPFGWDQRVRVVP